MEVVIIAIVVYTTLFSWMLGIFPAKPKDPKKTEEEKMGEALGKVLKRTNEALEKITEAKD
ncbi:MAG: hypothetical protein F6K36_20555 [Symploca sp. SIO3C6]|uniref:Uncharacterized protein n=1 Tax=Symploca sp. SIO1C4 TaxID=2607765 RepID=A0A6B3NPD6_9CYAN|nr:hypothetical protein [Symploca sp. SIO3C6]NER32094.1 hypothetical protein [Symploca sp. SIO1C4]NET08206.1 hypothetical protein [Symploca sp. SIO2B6]